MTATLVYDRTEPIAEDARRALDSALAPLGVRVKGSRDRDLVLTVFDANLAPQDDFQGALRAALESPIARPHWEQFDSAVYG